MGFGYMPNIRVYAPEDFKIVMSRSHRMSAVKFYSICDAWYRHVLLIYSSITRRRVTSAANNMDAPSDVPNWSINRFSGQLYQELYIFRQMGFFLGIFSHLCINLHLVFSALVAADWYVLLVRTQHIWAYGGDKKKHEMISAACSPVQPMFWV